MKKIFLIFILSFCLMSCYKTLGEDDVLDLSVWSPYINIHNFEFSLQAPHFSKLVDAGVVRGIRTGKLEVGSVSSWMFGGQIEVLGIFDNEYLRSPNVCEIFEGYVCSHSYIQYWEIGNEVEHFIGMSPEEYMIIFDKIYKSSRNLNVTLLSQAPFGNIDGSKIFKRMIDAGLNKYPDIIAALHFYAFDSKAIHYFAEQVDRLPLSTKVWVTEAGINQFSKHISFVNQIYPDIVNSLRAERIYWYVFSECGEHSLVSNLAPACTGSVMISPLYHKLIEGKIRDSSNSSSIFGVRRRQ
ncbi:MAG: hypothetical protein PHR56_09565 [Dehalococcoidales bacterium]|nr:hypothetical protein [Dehalococcoidales bacterium]